MDWEIGDGESRGRELRGKVGEERAACIQIKFSLAPFFPLVFGPPPPPLSLSLSLSLSPNPVTVQIISRRHATPFLNPWGYEDWVREKINKLGANQRDKVFSGEQDWRGNNLKLTET